MKKYFWIVAVALVLSAPSASAGKFYVGAGVGSSEFEPAPPAPPGFDSDDTAYKVVFGYNLNRVFSVEADFADYGDFSEQDDLLTLDANASAIHVYAVGIIPVGPKFDLYGKAGFSSWSADVTITDAGVPSASSPDGTDFAWGFGAAFHSRRHWSILVEWEVSEVDDLDKLSLGTVGFRWEF